MGKTSRLELKKTSKISGVVYKTSIVTTTVTFFSVCLGIEPVPPMIGPWSAEVNVLLSVTETRRKEPA